MGKRKGFTLTELIIVIAIIGILTAILIPSWSYYLQRSRIRSQNYKSKVIFNAAQTVITDLEFSERHYISFHENAEAGNTQALNYIYTPNGITNPANNKWYFYYNGHRGFQCDSDSNEITATAGTKKAQTMNSWNNKIQSAISTIIDDERLVYRIYVDGYTVVSVVSARGENDQFLGSHPGTFDKLRADGTYSSNEVRNERAKHIKGVAMTDFALKDYTPVPAT